MMILLLRLAPMLAGFAIYALFEWQWTHPLFFPWPLLGAMAAYLVIAARLVAVRKDRWDMMWKAIPGLLLLGSATVCSLLFEEIFWQHGLSLFVAIATYLSLELLFLLAYDPARYPVHGLTYLDVGIVPLTNALLVWGMVGVRTFQKLMLPFWMPMIVLMVVNAIGFIATSHPDATREQRRAWAMFGGAIGAALGVLILFLPLTMPAQAFLAALLVAAPLRLRRYGFSPYPPRAMAWFEGGVFLLLFIGLLLLSPWA
ncbi:hypothetical protein KBB27_03720 [Patescibacteria group bacterium]|nr:hypothetical protein [Patescibacteria group bacterium]